MRAPRRGRRDERRRLRSAIVLLIFPKGGLRSGVGHLFYRWDVSISPIQAA